MYLDLHCHSHYSFDGECHAGAMLAAAAERGVEELCFTDHVDFDIPTHHVPDFSARQAELTKLAEQYSGVKLRLGAEVSLKDGPCAAASAAVLQGVHPDLILGSVHTVDGVDVWDAPYYRGQDKRTAYRRYLETVAREISSFPLFHVLAHYDFVAKYAPYPDRSVTLDLAPDAFASIFRQLIQAGKGLEINTASWQQDPPWGLDILRFYRSLGGEFVTVGSDTHGAERVGARIGEALELARAAGIPYVASFQGGIPQMHTL